MAEFEYYMYETKENIAKAIVEGLIVLISIDDSLIDYQNIYEPDFKEYASKECFPIELLTPSQFKIPKVICFSHIIGLSKDFERHKL